ncbi:MAG TPA: right-handed parallel beta-helix repeat-containing protein [Xanthobacteraceae bacterium]|nr:right-handed parallel beta-helix repeat-containing protein [Xanthobacteraceae bacterium]
MPPDPFFVANRDGEAKLVQTNDGSETRHFYVVDSIADLRKYTERGVQRVWVTDKGPYKWDATSTAADNGNSVIRPNNVAVTDPGRFLMTSVGLPSSAPVPPVADYPALAALDPALLSEGQTRQVLSDPTDPWVYSLTGAGFDTDNTTIVRPTAISLGSPGRFYRASSNPVIPTFAALRLAPSGKHPTVSLKARSTLGDLGGGIFDWNSASTAADDDATIIAPTGLATGRWIRRHEGKANLKWWGGGSGGSDRLRINAALAWCAANSVTELRVPAGTYQTDNTFSDPSQGTFVFTNGNGPIQNIRIVGDGPTATKIVGASGDGGARAMIFVLAANIQIDGFHIEGGFGQISLRDCHNVAIRNCDFTVNASTGSIEIMGSTDITVENCTFFGKPDLTLNGQDSLVGVHMTNGSRGVRVKNNRFFGCMGVNGTASVTIDALGDATAVNDGIIDDVIITGNVFDGMWWLMPTLVSGVNPFTGTCTLTSNSLTATSGPTFRTFDNGTTVRLLQTIRAGTGQWADQGMIWRDAGASFLSTALLPGDIIRVGNTTGIIRQVLNNTDLSIERWFDTASLRHVAAPDPNQDALSYTAFKIWRGAVGSNTGTVITLKNVWHDLRGTNPANYTTLEAASVYEVIPHALWGTQGNEGCDRWICSGNIYLRNWADACSFYGNRIHVGGNHFVDNQDVSITVNGRSLPTVLYSPNFPTWDDEHGGSVISGNIIERAGTNAIACLAFSGRVVNNVVRGWGWSALFQQQAFLIYGGQGMLIQGNAISGAGMAGAAYGMYIVGTQFADVLNNRVEGCTTYGIWVQNALLPATNTIFANRGITFRFNRFARNPTNIKIDPDITGANVGKVQALNGAPTVTITGTPTANNYYVFILEITTDGPLGTAQFRWSSDHGKTWNGPTATGASVALTGTGLTAAFSAGTYFVAAQNGRVDQTGHWWIFGATNGALDYIVSNDGTNRPQRILSDASVTVTPGSDLISEYVLPAATLSNNRTVTLGTSGLGSDPAIVSVKIFDTTAHTFAVIDGGPGTPTLYTHGSGAAPAEFVAKWNGTNFVAVSVNNLLS